MAGRKAIPVDVHKMKGSYQKSRHAPMSAIDPSPGVGEPPLTLSGPATAAWELFAALLSKRKAVTAGDSAALEVLASTFVEWQELSADIQREGRVYECITSTGAVMRRPNPKVAMLSDAQRRLNTMLSEFGMSPASRGKVPALTDSTPVNKFAQLGRIQ
jgi:P27 family predicted phage terminase small subunit